MNKDQKSKIAGIPQLVFCRHDLRPMDGERLACPFLLDIKIVVYRNVHFAFEQRDSAQKIWYFHFVPTEQAFLLIFTLSTQQPRV